MVGWLRFVSRPGRHWICIADGSHCGPEDESSKPDKDASSCQIIPTGPRFLHSPFSQPLVLCGRAAHAIGVSPILSR